MSTALERFAQNQAFKRDELHDFEIFWRDHYEWLKDRGYLLRARYRPGWIASWTGTNIWPASCEDDLTPLNQYVMDAVHIQDGRPVMLRRPDPPSVSDELEIIQILSSEDVRADRRNHCVPIYETIQVPETQEERNLITVMPYLVRWDLAEFNTVGEVVDFMAQMFEGLAFLHSLNVAHNDTKDTNIMMDWSPLFSSPPHSLAPHNRLDWSGKAKARSRTAYPIKFHLIDWDLSKRYDLSNGIPYQTPGYGGDRTVPEFKRNEPCNPFAVDVYCLGNLIRSRFIIGDDFSPGRRNLEFMHELIADMTDDDPIKRPKMDQVVSRFEGNRKGLSSWKLRSRVSDKNEPLLFRVFTDPYHWIKQIQYMIRRIPAVPSYIDRNGE